MKTHREKLEKKRRKIIRRFNSHELSDEWKLHTKIASNKIHLLIERPNKYDQKVWKRLKVGLKDKVNLKTFLKV